MPPSMLQWHIGTPSAAPPAEASVLGTMASTLPRRADASSLVSPPPRVLSPH